ncbi:hypothetical protein LXA43DRAFT_1066519 [Ganoderma leucocontextum]|nr:hypothetical protein LXA43DRAFT_1066519 [Ganoderma leucocontextum]
MRSPKQRHPGFPTLFTYQIREKIGKVDTGLSESSFTVTAEEAYGPKTSMHGSRQASTLKSALSRLSDTITELITFRKKSAQYTIRTKRCIQQPHIPQHRARNHYYSLPQVKQQRPEQSLSRRRDNTRVVRIGDRRAVTKTWEDREEVGRRVWEGGERGTRERDLHGARAPTSPSFRQREAYSIWLEQRGTNSKTAKGKHQQQSYGLEEGRSRGGSTVKPADEDRVSKSIR